MHNKEKDKITVSKQCPICGRRILDKVTPTSGIISLKCNHCNNIVSIDLAFRRAVKYRMAVSYET